MSMFFHPAAQMMWVSNQSCHFLLADLLMPRIYERWHPIFLCLHGSLLNWNSPCFHERIPPFLAEQMSLFSNLAYVKDHVAMKEILNPFQVVNLMKADLYQNL